jgi:predicted nucleotide-binding protein
MRAEGQEENLKGEQDSIPNVPRSFWSASASKAGGSHVSPNPVQQVAAQPSRKVFVVHGRDEGAKNAVELFLRTIGIEPIILHKQAHLGRHLLTKFSQEAADVAFAVILMTPDDEGCEKGGTPNPRARQNVVFELGFFIGKFETARVAALITKGVEKPSDFDGIGYIDFDATGGWKTLLARELKGAGIPFDANAVLHA